MGSSTRTHILTLAATLALAGPAGAQSRYYESKVAEPVVPRYQTLRFEEDWSVLCDQADEDLFDPIKCVELTDDGSIWASFGGQLRERVELWDDFLFGATGSADQDDVYLLSRIRAHMDLHLTDIFRVFVEAKSALATDRDLPGGTRPTDVDSLDLQNAFGDVRLGLAEDDAFTIRGGRHELLFGDERLVGPVDWSNTRRTFDGISMIADIGGWRFTGFYTAPVEIQKHNFNEADEDQQFWGFHAAGEGIFGPDMGGGLDFYWLGLERENQVFNLDAGEEDRHTVGMRFYGLIPDTMVDYEIEGAYQFGDVSGADISAFMVTAEAGVALPGAPAELRLEGGFDYASGDDEPGDGDVETFNQLFPTGHKHLGYADVIGRQNIVDFRGRATLVPVGELKATIDTHYFLLASDDDALYDASGNIVRAGGLDGSNEVGWELDLTLAHPIGRHLVASGGYSHFFAGEMIEDTGPDDDIDFAYLALEYTF